MIIKVSKNIQRAKSYSYVGILKLFTVLYLLHKHVPISNKCMHKIKNKDTETSKPKKNEKTT